MDIKNIQILCSCASLESSGAEIQYDECKDFNENTLRAFVSKSLSEAQAQKHESVAFTDLGCIKAQFPINGAVRIMVQEILRYARAYSQPSLKKIIFCLPDKNTFRVFEQTVTGYLKHIQETLGPGPYVTVDIIIEVEGGIIVIERSNPPYGWALPGGFMDYGESLEEAAVREAKEETKLDLEDLRQFHTYSQPGRDPRFQTVSTVFVAKGKGVPQSGDDAKNLKIIPCADLLRMDYAFDHKDIIRDYLEKSQDQGRRF